MDKQNVTVELDEDEFREVLARKLMRFEEMDNAGQLKTGM